VPGQKIQDLRNWLIIYGYWNAGGSDNVAAMFWTLAERYLRVKAGVPPNRNSNMGLLHPDYQGFLHLPPVFGVVSAEGSRELRNSKSSCRDIAVS